MDQSPLMMGALVAAAIFGALEGGTESIRRQTSAKMRVLRVVVALGVVTSGAIYVQPADTLQEFWPRLGHVGVAWFVPSICAAAWRIYRKRPRAQKQER